MIISNGIFRKKIKKIIEALGGDAKPYNVVIDDDDALNEVVFKQCMDELAENIHGGGGGGGESNVAIVKINMAMADDGVAYSCDKTPAELYEMSRTKVISGVGELAIPEFGSMLVQGSVMSCMKTADGMTQVHFILYAQEYSSGPSREMVPNLFVLIGTQMSDGSISWLYKSQG